MRATSRSWSEPWVWTTSSACTIFRRCRVRASTTPSSKKRSCADRYKIGGCSSPNSEEWKDRFSKTVGMIDLRGLAISEVCTLLDHAPSGGVPPGYVHWSSEYGSPCYDITRAIHCCTHAIPARLLPRRDPSDYAVPTPQVSDLDGEARTQPAAMARGGCGR